MNELSARLSAQPGVKRLAQADPAAVRKYYQSVLDSVGSVVYTVDRDLRITGVNKQWDEFARANDAQQLVGEQVLGKRLLDQMHGAPMERWRMVCQQILDGELPRYLDEVIAEEASDWRFYSLAATPLRDGRGEIVGITFVATNITKLKKAEFEMWQRLVEVRGLRQVAHTANEWPDRRRVYKQVTTDIAHLFDADKCVIFLWDENTGNLQAQEPAYGLSGRKLTQLSLDMGHPQDPYSLWPDLEEEDYILLNEGDEAPADMVETAARVDKLAAMMAVLRVSARIHGAILVAGRDHPFTDQNGQLLAHLAIPIALSIENAELNRLLQDRTQQLANTRDELDRLIRLKEAIRMPLSVVRGYLELLLDGMMGPLSDGQLSALRTVLQKTHAVSELVNRLSPHRLPRDATRYEQIHLPELLQQVLDQWRPVIQRVDVNLVTDLPDLAVEDSLTVGDPDMLRQVFDTLVNRAVQVSPDGGTLKLSMRVLDGILHVRVTDSGAYIPPHRLQRVWKLPRNGNKGQPVNLAEVKRIVEGHGGQVWAESAPDQGSTFHVALRKLDR